MGAQAGGVVGESTQVNSCDVSGGGVLNLPSGDRFEHAGANRGIQPGRDPAVTPGGG
ncbi:hypothetical protein CLV47_10420 [Antricoccus suffuscus]|uniref:Uncharacterized protein n=1 Tax=Antricoccus suffuscus TaxID=1629062 RepID=A0A2T1A257_9ACTN|nr:hypothetical protein CLV47_10420 [Antricoccus suffuscus]